MSIIILILLIVLFTRGTMYIDRPRRYYRPYHYHRPPMYGRMDRGAGPGFGFHQQMGPRGGFGPSGGGHHSGFGPRGGGHHSGPHF